MADFMSRADLDFLLYDWLRVTDLTVRERFADHSRETFDAVLDLSHDMAAKLYAPHNKKSDQQEPRIGPDGTVILLDEITTAVRAFGEAGLNAGSFDAELGGMQLPHTLARASMVNFQAANASTSSYSFLTVGNANLLAKYGTAEQIDTWVRPMLAGRYSGTMCLSEPQAGSSLGDITTRAVRNDDGSYAVTGTKMWISAGDHEICENIVHLVLAKVPGGGPGVKGISLFIVPKVLENGTRNDVALVGLNHKMGNRGTTNTLLNFGENSAGAVGYLVGEEHRGLSYMFNMMNEARIGVGFLATALGYAGYLQSVEYAKVRVQGGVPIIEHADVARMLLAQKSYAEGALALGLYASRLLDEEMTAPQEAERARAHTLLEVLTPIVKSWPSQWCLEANSLAIQVHGGYGYTREFDVEQLYRDNRLNLIHEGAHGIHGLDLLGRKVIMDSGAGFAALAAAIGETVQRARAVLPPEPSLPPEPVEGYADQLDAAIARLSEVTSAVWSTGDPAVALANATAYLEAAGHIVVAWMWLEQLLAVGDRPGDFYDGKRAAAQYFFRYELPKIGPQLDLVASLDRTTLDADPAWF